MTRRAYGGSTAASSQFCDARRTARSASRRWWFDDDHVGLRRFASRLEQEALVEVRALQAPTEVRLGGDLVPHLIPRRHRQIAQRAVSRLLRPLRDRLQLVHDLGLEERATDARACSSRSRQR